MDRESMCEYQELTCTTYAKAVHHAYSKHAEVTVPSLDDWEKQWKKNPQEIVKPAVVQVDFRSQQVAPGISDLEPPLAAVAHSN